ncbi:hypothetical protein MNBD_GAMMA07-1707 [hydrothermal vent metagenome]|uniref:Type IV fimbrial biogenesis protein PilV n=1 Tax=hydrothermal vent metagenome TaxID=652676 RepID=A0A3B0WUK5_9ZZZZ
MLVKTIKKGKPPMLKHQQQGFTLMEVMIAAFVLAVGMLGSTAMMLRGSELTREIKFESIAAQVAMNMAERMRSNIQEVVNGSYDNLVADSANAVDCSVLCTPQNVALYHAYIWGQEIEDLFPSRNATATVAAINPGVRDSVYTITVNWDSLVRVINKTEESSIGATSYTMIFQP